MVYDILTKEIPLILPTFKKNKKENRGIITLLVTGFIGLTIEELSSCLHNKGNIFYKGIWCYEKKNKPKKK